MTELSNHGEPEGHANSFGFVRVGASVPPVFVARPHRNAERMIETALQAGQQSVQVLLFPEMSLTGYTCGDLFNQLWLRQDALEALELFLEQTRSLKMLSVLGMPLVADQQLFNVAVLACQGRILGVVPKAYIPGYKEFYEPRWFSPAKNLCSTTLEILRQTVPAGTDLLIKTNIDNLTVAVEICEDLFMSIPPSSLHACNGATLLLNLSASPETIAKADYRRTLVANQSARCNAAYIYVSSSSCIADGDSGESTADVVFGGHVIMAEYGVIIAESKRFESEPQLLISDIDVERLMQERTLTDSWAQSVTTWNHPYRRLLAEVQPLNISVGLRHRVEPLPFVPREPERLEERCREVLAIQQAGLSRRLRHIQTTTNPTASVRVAIGVSGGIDSTLALLATVQAYDQLGWERENIIGITMPGFGTTSRTHQNAVDLCHELGVDFREISIRDAVLQHLKDIGHEPCFHCLVCENAQARERTQILMDHGFTVGTGDLSEIALGYSTYNADQQSMYNVNAGVPKTLARHVIAWSVEGSCWTEAVQATLRDILATPSSPELVAAKPEERTVVSEAAVGPYELHDFFLFHFLRNGFTREKILFLVEQANSNPLPRSFSRHYSKEALAHWLNEFYRRFAQAQYKRDSMPGGPKIGSVALSQRGDWRMPADITFDFTS